uniref:hypothetical protein n=1 Tax=Ferroglobus placidus TaxID=54261 RepID=UPI00064E7A18|nr:hypothetical protein [Ferroglobus placidus]
MLKLAEVSGKYFQSSFHRARGEALGHYCMNCIFQSSFHRDSSTVVERAVIEVILSILFSSSRVGGKLVDVRYLILSILFSSSHWRIRGEARCNNLAFNPLFIEGEDGKLTPTIFREPFNPLFIEGRKL